MLFTACVAHQNVDSSWLNEAHSLKQQALAFSGNPDKPIRYASWQTISNGIVNHWEAGGASNFSWEGAVDWLDAKQRLHVIRLRGERAETAASRMFRRTGWLRDEVHNMTKELAFGRNPIVQLQKQYAAEVISGRWSDIVCGEIAGDATHVSCVLRGNHWIAIVPAAWVLDRPSGRSSDSVLHASVGLGEVTVENIYRLRHESDGYWPNDNLEQLAALESAKRGEVVAALKAYVVSGAEDDRACWAAAALIRLGEWTGDLLPAMQAPWLTEGLELLMPEARSNAIRWSTFLGALVDADVARQKVLDLIACRANTEWDDACEACSGFWLATTGDDAGSPSRVNQRVARISSKALLAAVNGDNGLLISDFVNSRGAALAGNVMRIHLHGRMEGPSIAVLKGRSDDDVGACMLLAEAGVDIGSEKLFTLIESGTPAVSALLEGELLECAWRSGWMPRLCRAAIARGGYMERYLRDWMQSDGLSEVADAEMVSGLEGKLRTMATARGSWSALAQMWVLR